MIRTGRIRARLMKDWSIDGHRLFVMQDTNERDPKTSMMKVLVASDLAWNEREEGGLWTMEDGIAQADDLIQAILDAGWEAGFRPRGFGDIKNETAALREHLSDMKTIAFHQLKIAK